MIVKKFTPAEAEAFLRRARAEMAQNSQRYGQQVVNNMRHMLVEPIPEIFYTERDHEVDTWFWNTWVQTDE